MTEVELQQLTAQNQNLIDENARLRKTIDELNLKVQELSSKLGVGKEQPVQSDRITINPQTVKDYRIDIMGVVPRENTVNFVVKDREGLLVPDVVCIIKDSSGRPTRAAKSNQLGQVLFTSPMPTGNYTLELTKSGYAFPLCELELNGRVLGSFEIRAI
ncbi:carboxypeptidase regulatory-like domain-containing protein [Candidatus Dojkabacteria bacterium]|nr:carboxypeptidase regulatory-like domain-containing protein [Candidatus Dojkabacteria bacterium]